MDKKYITKRQFMAITFLFILANDMTRGYFVREIQQHVWLTTLIAILGAIFLFFIYSFIYKNTNNAGFKKGLELITGKFLSKIIILVYIIYFIILSWFCLRDLVQMIHVYLISNEMISLYAIGILFALLYMVNKDIETFARLNDILFILTVFAFIFFSSLLLGINKSNFNGFLPFLPHGVKPLIRPALMMTYGIPMGELFVLIIIFQFVNPLQKKKAFKNAYLGILLGGLLLALITVYNVLYIPPQALSLSICPAMRVWRRIDLRDYIQRFDMLVINIITTHAVIKLFVFLFSTKELLGSLVKVKKGFIYPLIICIMLVVGIQFFGKSYSIVLEFKYNYIVRYLNLIFEVGIPVLIVLISFLRKKKIQTGYLTEYNI